jgi:hypothetical protein
MLYRQYINLTWKNDYTGERWRQVIMGTIVEMPSKRCKYLKLETPGCLQFFRDTTEATNNLGQMRPPGVICRWWTHRCRRHTNSPAGRGTDTRDAPENTGGRGLERWQEQ